MSQTNLMKRMNAVSTRTIIVVTCASVAGIMVLGAVIYVLISCQTKRKRRQTDHSLDIHRTVTYAHSGDSFIQSPPLTFPESRPTSSILVTGGPANKALPLFSIHETGLRHCATPAPGPTSSTRVQAPQNGGADPQESLMISRSQGDLRRHSVASVYSNISLSLSQYSFVSGSAYRTDEPTIGPRMSTISASLRDIVVPPLQGKTSKPPLKSILKPTKSPSTPLTPPTSRQPNMMTVPKSISSSALTLAPFDNNTSHASAFLRRRSQPNTVDMEGNLDYERDEQQSAFQPSVFRRRSSQPNVSYTGRHSSHSSSSVIPSISEAPSNESPVVESSPLTQPPLRSSPRTRRKPRPEPLRLRPRENYASIVYARARGPTSTVPSPRKGPARGYTFPPTLAPIRDSLSIPREYNPSNQDGDNFSTTTILEERYSASQFQRTRPTIPSPTWSTFRDSPGWV